MKIPRWKGGLASTYLFSLACFFIGLAVLTVFSLGLIKYDDRESPGFNPISKMPDGEVGLSEFAIMCAGFVVVMAFPVLLMLLK